MRRTILFVALVLVVGACGDDDSTVTTGASSTTTTLATTTSEATTTTQATTTTEAATTTAETTTTVAAGGYTVDILDDAVLQDGDPWVVPISGVTPVALTNDDIWPLEGELTFPAAHTAYEEAGFIEGSFAFFAEPDQTALVLTGAHLFEDADGAEIGLDLLTASFSDPELMARITGLPEGSLNMLFDMAAPALGDDGYSVMLSGPEASVVGHVWITDNLLQFVRIGMPLGDEDRSAASIGLMFALAERVGADTG